MIIKDDLVEIRHFKKDGKFYCYDPDECPVGLPSAKKCYFWDACDDHYYSSCTLGFADYDSYEDDIEHGDVPQPTDKCPGVGKYKIIIEKIEV